MPEPHDIELIRRARAQVGEVRARGMPSFTSSAGGGALGPQSPLRAALPEYDLLNELYRGGQGVVYRALQKSTKREVALKVMHEGPFSGPADRLRFEREVEILATLRHPSIVTVHDRGMADGLHYLVMDLINGQRLDEYIRTQRPSVREVLRLFARIADAVNAAHLRGVIHRDLKPSNVLVDMRGHPSVLDFGLARQIVDDQSEHQATQTGQFVGSLPWASPEQVEGHREALDVRTDVYSLGVMLYQMLAGEFPYSVSGGVRVVTENIVRQEPRPLAAHQPGISHEVGTIVHKCLQKSPDRRYQNAGELARDIDRYLRNEPIEAKRDSTFYVIRKSLRRYRLGLGVAAAFVLVVTAAAITLGIQYRQQAALRALAEEQTEVVARERDRARDYAADARRKFEMAIETVTFLMDEVATKMDRVLGAHELHRELLTAAYERFRPLMKEHSEDPELRYHLARLRLKMSRIAFRLGKRDEAQQYPQEALASLEMLVQEHPDDLRYLLMLGSANGWIGHNTRDRDEKQMRLRRYLEIAGQLRTIEPDNLAFLREESLAFERLAYAARQRGDHEERGMWLDKMLAAKRQLVAGEPENRRYQRDLAVALEAQSKLARALEDYEKSERMAVEAQPIAEALVAAEPQHPKYLRTLSNNYEDMAELARIHGQREDERRWTERMYEIKTRLVALEPANPIFQHDLAIAKTRLGRLLFLEEQFEDWMRLEREAFKTYEALVSADPGELRYRQDLATSLHSQAAVAGKEGDHSATERFLKRSLEAHRYVLGKQATLRTLRESINVCDELAVIALTRDEFQDALDLLTEGIRYLDRVRANRATLYRSMRLRPLRLAHYALIAANGLEDAPAVEQYGRRMVQECEKLADSGQLTNEDLAVVLSMIDETLSVSSFVDGKGELRAAREKLALSAASSSAEPAEPIVGES